jgi:hypothetical protein
LADLNIRALNSLDARQTGVMLPWNFVAGNESDLLAGGQLSQGAVQNMMGIAEVECVLLDPSIVISSMNVSVSSCRRTYYFINTNGTLTPNATTVSLRDPKFLVSVATMASMSNASAIVISGGLDIGHVNGMNASAVPASTNITWFRPILGAAGLLNSLTGQEFIAIPSTFISSTGESLLNWVNMTNSTTSSNSSGSSSGNSGGSPWIF